MDKPTVEIRKYVYTELVYLDPDGYTVYRETLDDVTWDDTLETRGWTDDEMADYGYLLEEEN